MSDPVALVAQLEAEMKEAAKALDFEQAARLRDQLFEVKARAARRCRRPGAAADNGARGGLAQPVRAER